MRTSRAESAEHKTHAQDDHAVSRAGGHGHQGHAGHDHSAMVADFRQRFWVSLALTVPVLALSPLIQSLLGLRDALAFPGSDYVLFALSAVVFFYGGWPFLKGLLAELSKHRPGMMTLIALAIGVAFFYSSAVVFGLTGKVFFWELVTLIDIMLLGHWIEMRSVMGASGALEALVQLLPANAHRLTAAGESEDVPISALRPGDRILVKPGEKVPIDGVVVKGRSSFNESMLTGESRPVEKGEGAEAVGGAVNGEGAVTLEVRKTGDKTYLSQVIDMVKRAQETRSRTQDIANRAALWLTYIALTAGGLTLVSWLLLGQGFEFGLERMVTVMVITCPHALGLAVPLVVAVSTSLTAKNGLLIRDRAAFERARNLNAVIFDKTGTLTEGRFGITDIVPLRDMAEDEILRWAVALESQSEHPIAQGILRSAAERGIKPAPVEEFKNLTGQGAEAVVSGRRVRVVSPSYLERNGLRADSANVRRVAAQGKTVVYVLLDDEPIGAIALADVIRSESFDAVARLKGLGIQCMMLTGDTEEVARAVAGELGQGARAHRGDDRRRRQRRAGARRVGSRHCDRRRHGGRDRIGGRRARAQRSSRRLCDPRAVSGDVQQDDPESRLGHGLQRVRYSTRCRRRVCVGHRAHARCRRRVDVTEHRDRRDQRQVVGARALARGEHGRKRPAVRQCRRRERSGGRGLSRGLEMRDRPSRGSNLSVAYRLARLQAWPLGAT